MRLFLVLVLLAAAPAAPAEEVVRIAVADDAHAPVEVSGEGLRARPLREGAAYAEVGGGKALVRPAGTGVALKPDDPGAPGIRFRADGPMQVAGRTVLGSVEVLLTAGKLVVVNEIGMEDYLAAVLGGEMSPSFPPEALKAQAVAARTYAVGKKLAAEGKPYHLGATVLSQVYGGAAREDVGTRQAVETTRGEVLTSEHAPIEAYFFSSCGGRTADGADALGRPLPYLVSTSCPESAKAPGAAWALSLSARDVSRLLGVPAVTELRIAARSPSGRARTVAVRTSAGEQKPISAVELRRRLGYDELRSLWFTVEKVGDRFRFEGKGSGHGAGLCQWGARAMAESGASYREILAHYYPGAELTRMY